MPVPAAVQEEFARSLETYIGDYTRSLDQVVSRQPPRVQDQGADMALDRATHRTYDSFGRLHVGQSNISKANICEYRGNEIPNAEALGLDPRRMYRLYRDPQELARAAPTFNNLPILHTHVPVSADAAHSDKVIGSTGTDATYEHPYLRNSLVFWHRDAIDGIEDGDRRQLSSAYSYDPDMTPGEIDGDHYDGVMRNIKGNHVALVPEGRAGDDVVVGDAKPQTQEKDMPAAKKQPTQSRMALLASGALIGYLTPKLAQDQRLPDLRPVLKGVDAKNYRKLKKGIGDGVVKLMRGRLAEDATLDNIHDFLDSVDKPDAGGIPPEEVEDQPPTEPLKAGAPNNGLEGQDDDEVDNPQETAESALAFLVAHMAELKALLAAAGAGGGGQDEENEEEKVHDPAEDSEENPNEGKVSTHSVNKPAMDAAIRKAQAETRRQMREIAEAEKFIAPWVGDLAMAMDSATDVFKAALDALSIDVEGIHPSAYRKILELQPKPGERQRSFAMDRAPAAASKTFAERFPDVGRLKVV